MTLLLALLATSTVAARQPISLGISMGGNGRNLSALDNFTASIGGNQPALWSIWSQWGSRGSSWNCYTDGPSAGTCRFPTETVEALPAGVLPVIWWEPWNPDNWEKGRFERYKRIVQGKHDSYIRKWARDAAAYGDRIVLRLAHEANGNFFPWSIRTFDNNATNYKKAWRRIWQLFQQEGATNVEFLWSVSKQSCRGCNPYAKVYPGDKYVDWAGITAFNWGPKKTWIPLVTAMARPMKQVQAITKKKIILAETASHFRGGNKAAWIKYGYNKAYRQWPRLRAIIYLNVDRRVDKHPDWRLVKPNDGSALAAYAAIAAKPEFQGSLPTP